MKEVQRCVDKERQKIQRDVVKKTKSVIIIKRFSPKDREAIARGSQRDKGDARRCRQKDKEGVDIYEDKEEKKKKKVQKDAVEETKKIDGDSV